MSPRIITAPLGDLGCADPERHSLVHCTVVSCFCSEQDRNPNNYLEGKSLLFTY